MSVVCVQVKRERLERQIAVLEGGLDRLDAELARVEGLLLDREGDRSQLAARVDADLGAYEQVRLQYDQLAQHIAQLQVELGHVQISIHRYKSLFTGRAGSRTNLY